jgi:hypothetical protein
MYMENGELQEEFSVDAPLVGRKHDRPTISFSVGRDVFVGYFVIVRLNENEKRLCWIAWALTNVNAKPIEHPNCILM